MRPRINLNDSELTELYNAGLGIKAIAARYSVSHMTIARRLRCSDIAQPSLTRNCYPLQIATEASYEGGYCLAVDSDGVCKNRAIGGRIYCPKHWLRAARHGDPAIVAKRGRKASKR